MQLDHLFVVARADGSGGASAAQAGRWADALSGAGFVEGPPRRHPGQGTANRSFFLEHIMLELLYVDDADALEAAAPEPLALHRRFTDPMSSPFGIAFRPNVGVGRDDAMPAFDSVAYRPGYLPDGLHIDVATRPGPSDPLLFHLAFAGAFWDGYDAGEAGNARVRLRQGRLVQPSTAHDDVRRALDQASIGIDRAPDGAHRLCLDFVVVDGASSRIAPGPVTLPDDLPLAMVVSRRSRRGRTTRGH